MSRNPFQRLHMFPASPAVPQDYAQSLCQEGHLPHPDFQDIKIKYHRLRKNFLIWHKRNPGTRLLRRTGARLFQRVTYMPSFIPLLIDLPFLAYFNLQPLGKRIYHGSTHAMQAAGDLVSPTAEFSSGMQDGKYYLHCRNTRFMINSDRNSPPVVNDGNRIPLVNSDINRITETGQRFIYRIIHDLIDQMMQPSAGCSTYIHSGTFPDSLQPFQNLNLIRTIFMFHCSVADSFLTHISIPFLVKPAVSKSLISDCFLFFVSSVPIRVTLPSATLYTLSISKR